MDYEILPGMLFFHYNNLIKFGTVDIITFFGI